MSGYRKISGWYGCYFTNNMCTEYTCKKLGCFRVRRYTNNPRGKNVWRVFCADKLVDGTKYTSPEKAVQRAENLIAVIVPAVLGYVSATVRVAKHERLL